MAAISTFGCVPLQNKIAEINAQHQVNYYRGKLADGSFETIVQQNKQILQDNEKDPPADIALYALGEVYAHYDYAGRDLGLSQYYFEKLIKNFPDSPQTPEAKIYISFFETIAVKEKEASTLRQNLLQKEKYVHKKVKKVPAIIPRKIVEENKFEEAVKKNMQVLEEANNKKPADEALYNLGLIFAHADNPDKDFKKSQTYLSLLTEQFPDSEFAEEAQVLLGLFDTIEKIQQIDIEIEQQKKKLTR